MNKKEIEVNEVTMNLDKEEMKCINDLFENKFEKIKTSKKNPEEQNKEQKYNAIKLKNLLKKESKKEHTENNELLR